MHRCLRRTLSLLVSAWLVSPGFARAQEIATDTLLTVDHYLDWEQVSDPQVSPDGARIVYTRRWVNKIEDKWEPALWIMNADGSHNRFLVKGADARGRPTGRGSSTSQTASRRVLSSLCAGSTPRERRRRSRT